MTNISLWQLAPITFCAGKQFCFFKKIHSLLRPESSLGAQRLDMTYKNNQIFRPDTHCFHDPNHPGPCVCIYDTHIGAHMELAGCVPSL